MLAVVLSRNARARAVQLPAWNEALGLPRPFDQQWSLRLQQIMAYETDLLEYGDIFEGSREIENRVASLKTEALAELVAIEAMGGAVAAIESGYMKRKLVQSNTRRLEAIERGEQIVVGVNRFTESESSPLTHGGNSIIVIPPHVEAEQVARLQSWRAARDDQAVQQALVNLRKAGRGGRQYHGFLDSSRQGGSHDWRMGRGAACDVLVNIARRRGSARWLVRKRPTSKKCAPKSSGYL